MTFPSSRPAASPPSSASSSSLHLVILAAREGWHTRELTRALEARGHTGAIVPYEGLVAVDRPPARPPEPRGRPRPRGRRARPHHPLRLARADHLPGGRAAPPGGPRRAGHELAAGHRADGGQVLDLGAARAVRAADAGDHRLRDARGGVRRVPRAGRRDREAAVRLDGPGHGAGERRGNGVPGLQDDRDRSAASTICSAPSTTRAGTSARSSWADACWRRSSAARTAGAPTSPAAGRRGPSSSPRHGARSPCGRRRQSAPSTRASICCRPATARYTCSR